MSRIYLSFAERLNELRQYVEQFGNANVPARWPGNPRLAAWVANQRHMQRKGKLDPDRVAALAALGFDFSSGLVQTEDEVERRIEMLQRFRAERGKSTGIPPKADRNKEYAALAAWVQRMRRMHAGGELPKWIADRLLKEGVGLEMAEARKRKIEAHENDSFQVNLDVLCDWLEGKEIRDTERDLSYRDSRKDPGCAKAYHFIEHQVLKARQGILPEEHRARLVMLGFTVNRKPIDQVLNPPPSIRTPVGIETTRAQQVIETAAQEARLAAERAAQANLRASHAEREAMAALERATAARLEAHQQEGETRARGEVSYLTSEELALKINYDVRTIRDQLLRKSFIEGIHYIRPFGGRKILYIWEAIERDMRNGAFTRRARGGGAGGRIGRLPKSTVRA